jgi:hypothetical protein
MSEARRVAMPTAQRDDNYDCDRDDESRPQRDGERPRS